MSILRHSGVTNNGNPGTDITWHRFPCVLCFIIPLVATRPYLSWFLVRDENDGIAVLSELRRPPL